MRLNFSIVVVLLFGLCLTATGASVTFKATGMGNAWPFDEAYGTGGYQQVYSGSKFGTTPVTLTGVTFGLAFPQYYEGGGWTLAIGLSSHNPGVPLNNNLNNLGPDFGQVYSGTSAPDNGQASFIFQTPYTFNPAGGDLLMNITMVANDCGGCAMTAGYSTDISRIFKWSGAYADHIQAESGYGLNTTFQTATPEPSTYGMMGLGLAALGLLRRRK
ncbi:MAG: PEP-CTERM sorting domain-containing protein [Candidatus Doudnabacteria bacterium]|jgi:hypothetical protein